MECRVLKDQGMHFNNSSSRLLEEKIKSLDKDIHCDMDLNAHCFCDHSNLKILNGLYPGLSATPVPLHISTKRKL